MSNGRAFHDGAVSGGITRREVHRMLAAAGVATATFGVPTVGRAATTMNFVGWQGYDTPLTAGGFMEANDLTLQTTYVSTNEEIATKVRGGAAGTIDIGTPEIKYIQLWVRQGVCEPIDMSQLSNYGQLIPFFANQELLKVDGEQYGAPFTWGTQPMMYRPDLVTETPTSWLDVLKREYKGKVVMVGSHMGNIMVWGKVVTGAEIPSWMTPAQLTETIDFLIMIKKEHARAYATSFGEMADILARGDAVISTLGWEPVAKWAAEKGAKVAMTYPVEGTTGFLDTYIVPKDAPNYDQALAAIDNALSVQAQLGIASELGQGIVNQDAVDQLAEAERAAYPYDDLVNLADRAKFYPFPPIEDDGVHATYQMILDEWERFKRA